MDGLVHRLCFVYETIDEHGAVIITPLVTHPAVLYKSDMHAGPPPPTPNVANDKCIQSTWHTPIAADTDTDAVYGISSGILDIFCSLKVHLLEWKMYL